MMTDQLDELVQIVTNVADATEAAKEAAPVIRRFYGALETLRDEEVLEALPPEWVIPDIPDELHEAAKLLSSPETSEEGKSAAAFLAVLLDPDNAALSGLSVDKEPDPDDPERERWVDADRRDADAALARYRSVVVAPAAPRAGRKARPNEAAFTFRVSFRTPDGRERSHRAATPQKAWGDALHGAVADAFPVGPERDALREVLRVAEDDVVAGLTREVNGYTFTGENLAA